MKSGPPQPPGGYGMPSGAPPMANVPPASYGMAAASQAAYQRAQTTQAIAHVQRSGGVVMVDRAGNLWAAPRGSYAANMAQAHSMQATMAGQQQQMPVGHAMPSMAGAGPAPGWQQGQQSIPPPQSPYFPNVGMYQTYGPGNAPGQQYVASSNSQQYVGHEGAPQQYQQPQFQHGHYRMASQAQSMSVSAPVAFSTAAGPMPAATQRRAPPQAPPPVQQEMMGGLMPTAGPPNPMFPAAPGGSFPPAPPVSGPAQPNLPAAFVGPPNPPAMPEPPPPPPPALEPQGDAAASGLFFNDILEQEPPAGEDAASSFAASCFVEEPDEDLPPAPRLPPNAAAQAADAMLAGPLPAPQARGQKRAAAGEDEREAKRPELGFGPALNVPSLRVADTRLDGAVPVPTIPTVAAALPPSFVPAGPVVLRLPPTVLTVPAPTALPVTVKAPGKPEQPKAAPAAPPPKGDPKSSAAAAAAKQEAKAAAAAAQSKSEAVKPAVPQAAPRAEPAKPAAAAPVKAEAKAPPPAAAPKPAPPKPAPPPSPTKAAPAAKGESEAPLTSDGPSGAARLPPGPPAPPPTAPAPVVNGPSRPTTAGKGRRAAGPAAAVKAEGEEEEEEADDSKYVHTASFSMMSTILTSPIRYASEEAAKRATNVLRVAMQGRGVDASRSNRLHFDETFKDYSGRRWLADMEAVNLGHKGVERLRLKVHTSAYQILHGLFAVTYRFLSRHEELREMLPEPEAAGEGGFEVDDRYVCEYREALLEFWLSSTRRRTQRKTAGGDPPRALLGVSMPPRELAAALEADGSEAARRARALLADPAAAGEVYWAALVALYIGPMERWPAAQEEELRKHLQTLDLPERVLRTSKGSEWWQFFTRLASDHAFKFFGAMSPEDLADTMAYIASPGSVSEARRRELALKALKLCARWWLPEDDGGSEASAAHEPPARAPPPSQPPPPPPADPRRAAAADTRKELSTPAPRLPVSPEAESSPSARRGGDDEEPETRRSLRLKKLLSGWKKGAGRQHGVTYKVGKRRHVICLHVLGIARWAEFGPRGPKSAREESRGHELLDAIKILLFVEARARWPEPGAWPGRGQLWAEPLLTRDADEYRERPWFKKLLRADPIARFRPLIEEKTANPGALAKAEEEAVREALTEAILFAKRNLDVEAVAEAEAAEAESEEEDGEEGGPSDAPSRGAPSGEESPSASPVQAASPPSPSSSSSSDEEEGEPAAAAAGEEEAPKPKRGRGRPPGRKPAEAPAARRGRPSPVESDYEEEEEEGHGEEEEDGEEEPQRRRGRGRGRKKAAPAPVAGRTRSAAASAEASAEEEAAAPKKRGRPGKKVAEAAEAARVVAGGPGRRPAAASTANGADGDDAEKAAPRKRGRGRPRKAQAGAGADGEALPPMPLVEGPSVSYYVRLRLFEEGPAGRVVPCLVNPRRSLEEQLVAKGRRIFGSAALSTVCSRYGTPTNMGEDLLQDHEHQFQPAAAAERFWDLFLR